MGNQMVTLNFDSDSDILEPKEVAQYLHKSISWVYKHSQALGGRKLGGSLFFPGKEDLYERLFRQGKGVEVRSTPKRNPIHQGRVQDEESGQKGRSKKKGGTDQPDKRVFRREDANRHNLLGPDKSEA
ncbi:hypothetical protein DSCA_18540 [Desulfosarcina alkanivorans]|uniref:Uncharacterized protein n=1 Tax=Desulfosarcina alkanivorans TaxID=571177 RepID=A0A5K7YNK8_9BACT|nr:hypothetical protein DSCA_18540 [Desulfosarcina alkanivorans]